MKTKIIIGTVAAVGITALLVSLRLRTSPPRVTASAEVGDPVVAAPVPPPDSPLAPAGGGIVASSTIARPETAAPTNLAVRLFSYSKTNQPPHLTLAQAETFAQQNHRRPEALLAAYQASLDKSFLREAMEKHPQDPRVALAAALQGGPYNSDAEAAQSRRAWLDTFKQSAPDNALADYLSAREHFKSGEPGLGVKDVLAAAAKPMHDYSLDWIQNTEEAYRSAGYPETESKAMAEVTLLLPHLAQLRDLGNDLIETAKTYREGGDEGSAQTLLQTAANIGSRLDAPGTLTFIQSLVGVALQQNVLKSLDPATTFGDTGQTVQSQLDQLQQRRDDIRAMAKQFDKLLPGVSEQDVATYFDRLKVFGEEAAERWALNQQGGQ